MKTCWFVMAILTVSLALSAVTAHAAPVLYSGEMVVKKVSGKACKPEDVGKPRKMELAFDRAFDGLFNGYFAGEMVATGRFGGSDAMRLAVLYPHIDKELAEGHVLALQIEGERIIGTLREKHLADTVDNCNFDEADLKLTRSSGDAAQFLRRSDARFNAVVTKEQAYQLYKQKKYAEAIPLYEKALALREVADGKTAEAVSWYLNSLVRAYGNAGRYDDARRLLDDGLTRFPAGEVNKMLTETRDWLKVCETTAADDYFNQARQLEDKRAYTQAIALYEKALEIDRRIRPKDAATVLLHHANCYKKLQQWRQAEEYYKESIALVEKEYGLDSKELATRLNNLACLYDTTGRYVEAEPLYKRALAIFEKTLGTEHQYYAAALNNLSALYYSTGRYAEAEPLLKRILSISEKTLGPENPNVTTSLNNLAYLYGTTGYYAEAEPLLKRALAIDEKALGLDHPDTARDLNNLGGLYVTTGRYAEAEPLYKRALGIAEKTLGPEHLDVAVRLNNFAYLYGITGRYAEAEPLLKRALAIDEKTLGPEHESVAIRLNSLAGLYRSTGRYAEAEPLCKRALAIREKALGPEHASVAASLNSLAGLYRTTGRYAEAELLCKRALRIARNAGVPDLLHHVQTGYSTLLENQNNPEAAIFFGKQAVNTIQGMRQNISGLGKETLKSFDATVESSYRRLSRLLVAQGRLPEAERVLELLKEQEYFQFVRRTSTTPLGQAPMTSFETAQDRLLAEAGEPLARLTSQMAELKKNKQRTPEQETQLKELTNKYNQASDAFAVVLQRVVTTLSATRADKGEELKDAQSLQSDLRRLGKGVVALYTIADKDSYTLILITPDYRRAYTVPAKDLATRITTLRSQLRNPGLDPRPLAKELHDIVLPPEAVKELTLYQATTLMWHLDGPLRYLPLSALYDGKHYLVEKYRISLFTAASRGNLKDNPQTTWQGLGLGVSEARTVQGRQFAPLNSVPRELATVIRQQDQSGVIPGEQYLNNAFTWQTMQEKLDDKGKYPLIHIASHFHLEPGNDTQSFLLPGGGDPITLDLINKQNNLFDGVDLLTLSACETAYSGGKTADGREVDGLSILAQRQGAKAVIATLWPVADDSTAMLMQQFYQLRETQQLPKAEALRLAQLALLNGTAPATPDAIQRGSLRLGKEAPKAVADAKPFTPDPSRPYAHPYFWAPFVLMGNWK